jgi:Uma2 family endonuclease
MQTQREPALSVLPQSPRLEANQCVILKGISWETYERLLAEHTESSGTHFTYDQGRLEIMVLSAEREALKQVLEVLVEIFAEELNIDVRGFGSTTFRRADLDRGFEPDACFYIQHEPQVRGKREIRLSVDPPPDLIIEIDIFHPSLNKLPLFATLRIPEVWRFNDERVIILKLVGETYEELAESTVLPGVTSEALSQFVKENSQMQPTVWRRNVREWARKNLIKAS